MDSPICLNGPSGYFGGKLAVAEFHKRLSPGKQPHAALTVFETPDRGPRMSLYLIRKLIRVSFEALS